VLFPAITAPQIEMIMAGCLLAAAATGAALLARRRRRPNASEVPAHVATLSAADKLAWRMPPLADLPAPVISGGRKWGLMALQAYLALAMAGVIVKIVFLAIH
jgi:hypothetical protein